jgi:aryl-alcohol dehydrogenase-like predicted oxidoreductase
MTMPSPGSRPDVAADAGGWPEAWEIYANERTWSIVDTLVEVAEETGRSPAQVALRWLMQQPAVTAPIIGARTPAQLEDNLAAADTALSHEHMDRLTTVSDRPLPYPFGLLRRFQRR